MSVVVIGMEMPKNCMECKIKQYVDYENDYSVCPFSDVMCLSIGRQDACPLGELPDKHGRLGDLDALIIDLMDRGLEGIQTDDWAEIQQTVMEQPTIVEAEGSE